jgi:hypothetical protein
MPNFENTIEAHTYGTHLIGYIETRYDTLVQVFGEPTMSGGVDDKSHTQWNLEFEDGTVATIYDWKEPELPLELYNWHVGGRGQEALSHVLDTVHEALEAQEM